MDGVAGRRRRAVLNIIVSHLLCFFWWWERSDRGALLGPRRRRGEWPRHGAGAFRSRRRSYRALWSRRRRGNRSRRGARASFRPRRARDGARRWRLRRRDRAHPLRIALPGRLELRMQYVELLEKCRIRLRLRSRGAHQLERGRGVERLCSHQMSNYKRRRPRNTAVAVHKNSAVVQAARNEVQHRSEVLGRVLGRRVIYRHSKVAQLPFKKRRAAGARVLGFRRRTVYYRLDVQAPQRRAVLGVLPVA